MAEFFNTEHWLTETAPPAPDHALSWTFHETSYKPDSIAKLILTCAIHDSRIKTDVFLTLSQTQRTLKIYQKNNNNSASFYPKGTDSKQRCRKVLTLVLIMGTVASESSALGRPAAALAAAHCIEADC